MYKRKKISLYFPVTEGWEGEPPIKQEKPCLVILMPAENHEPMAEWDQALATIATADEVRAVITKGDPMHDVLLQCAAWVGVPTFWNEN